MYFQLRKLILWPRFGTNPRVVEFTPGVVNVISGASKTGKSAVVPIVDYCLGADKCAIPVGIIRESCAWFGILIDTLEGQKLFARREPGDQQRTGDMFVVEGVRIEVPPNIEERNSNVEIVKSILNRLSGLTTLGFDPLSESGFDSRPSFRDLMAFTFQPQNIVANPDVMFFKADTTEHREKLKTIFPYVLGAVTAEILQSRFELDRLARLLRRKETELRRMETTSAAWQLEAQSWIRRAIEFGLLPADERIPEDWPSILDQLRQVVSAGSHLANPSLAGIDVVLGRLEVLRAQESEVATTLTQHRQKLNELRRLFESSAAYGGAMKIQRDRLALADWLRSLTGVASDDPIVETAGARQHLVALCDTLSAIELGLQSHPAFSDTLDKEILRQREATETVLERLHQIRREIDVLEKNSAIAQELADRFDRMERFLGRLEQALQLYDAADESSDLRAEINDLRAAVERLQKIISEADIRRRLRNALDRVQDMAGRLIPRLDAEWPDSPIRLMIEDLTVKVIRGTRDDYLWEIGSGANWLAYHVAITLALQKFFLEEPQHCVPGLLIYDQPSQVYFPKRSASDEELDLGALRDEDIDAVRKVFSLLGQEVHGERGRLQIIVLDHAHEEVWGGLQDVELIEEWRGGRALVPADWPRP